MPEDLDNLEDDQPDDGGPKGLRDALKREKAEKAELQARLAQVERDQAFRDAGVDLTNPLHKAAAAGYDGDTAGIGAWVSDLGLTQPSTPPPAVGAEERAALERIGNASAGDGGAPPPEQEADKNDELRAVTDQSIREGWTNSRYQDEMRRVVQKYGGDVRSMDIEQTFGVTR